MRLRCVTGPVWMISAAVVVLIVVGCQGRQGENAGEVTTVSTGDPSAPDSGPLFADWPKENRQGAILISGEQNGYLEPCGCTSGQRGGLARRLDLVNRMKKEGWDVAPLDLGSLINDPHTHGGPIETRIRYTYALKALEILDYDAMALSSTDLKLGVGEVIMQYMNFLGNSLKVVSANVTPQEGLNPNQAIVPSLRTAAGTVTIGVTAVMEPEEFSNLVDPDKELMLQFQDPAAVLPGVLADLETDTKLQVLLVQGSEEYARQLAHDFPGFEIIVSRSQYVEPPRDPEILNDGKTQLITVGKKGQYVGVVGLYEASPVTTRYARVDLNQRYNNKTEAMRRLIDEDFQDALQQANVLSDYPRRPYVFGSTETEGAVFVGAQACQSCHPRTYEQWANTKHAHAYDALTSDPKRIRIHDAQCISCHTVGFEYESGYVTADLTPQFKNVQCENCHGPGSLHVTDPDNDIYQLAVARDRDDFEKNQRCVQCHTEDDSPHFDFATYWPKVLHSGLDSYNDPKVHEGLDLNQLAGEQPASHAAE